MHHLQYIIQIYYTMMIYVEYNQISKLLVNRYYKLCIVYMHVTCIIVSVAIICHRLITYWYMKKDIL